MAFWCKQKNFDQKKGLNLLNCKNKKFQITKLLYKDLLLAMYVEGWLNVFTFIFHMCKLNLVHSSSRWSNLWWHHKIETMLNNIEPQKLNNMTNRDKKIKWNDQ